MRRAGAALVGLAQIACGVTPRSTGTATADEMGHGVASVEELGESWTIVGSAGHAGRHEVRAGDSVWRVRLDRLELCRGGAGRWTCAPVPTDGVPPDTLLGPGTTREGSGAPPTNVVWVRALPGGLITDGRGGVAYCSAEVTPARCAAARFPRARGFVSRVLATHQIARPVRRDVAWLLLDVAPEGAAVASPGRTGDVARCAADPWEVAPRCELATLDDVAEGAP